MQVSAQVVQFSLDGAFSVCVADGVDVWVGVGLVVAGPAGAHAVLLLAEQRGGFSWTGLQADRGQGLLGFRGQRWARVQGSRRRG